MASKMKVLQINSVCGIGSTGRIATDIHEMLLSKGHESKIAFGRGNPINCEDPIKIGTDKDVYAHVAKTRIFDKHGQGSKRATENFIKKIETWNPDVIHLHNIHGYYINIEILFQYLKRANKPVVWTLHDCWSFTGHCTHFDYIGCEKWKTGCYNCPQKKEYPRSILLDNSKDNYLLKKKLFTGINNLTIVTPSKWLANLVKTSYLKKYPVKVINNGIDLDIFKPTNSDFKKLNNLQNKYIILGVANVWNQQKGLDFFIELNNYLLTDEKIVLVGLSNKQAKRLPEDMIGITRTENIDELVKIYSDADMYVNFTLEEVFGLTNVEAAACGIPVVSFDSGGCSEVINEFTGKIVMKNDFTRAVKEIRNLRHNPLNQELQLEYIRKNFNKNDIYNKYIDLYNSI